MSTTVLHRLSPFAVPRRPSEWWTDSLLFAGSLLLWWVNSSPAAHPQIADAYWPVDRAIGLTACALIWWTRRYPLTTALLLVIPGTVSISAGLTALVGVFRVAQLRRPRVSVPVTALHLACGLPYHAFAPLPGLSLMVWLVVIPLLYLLSLLLGLLSRSRRQVIAGLHESAARDRERYEHRLAATRQEERERIAREMHDVLAHRISLLSVHAGALEFRAGSPAAPTTAEVRDAARVIRENAHLAVEDLRELLALLRTDDDDLTTGRPQPRLTDIARLAEEAAAAGQQVDLRVDVDPATLRESAQRTVYRVVQESLTNARKHAPAARVRVRVSETGDAVHVAVDNPVPVGLTDTDLPVSGEAATRGGPGGHGSGLVGLAERVRLDGGTLVHGIEAGRFRVRADLPRAAR